MRWLWIPSLFLALAAHVGVFAVWQLVNKTISAPSSAVTFNLQVAQSASESSKQTNEKPVERAEPAKKAEPQPAPVEEAEPVVEPSEESVSASQVEQVPVVSEEDAYLTALSAKLSQSLFYPDKAKRRKWEGTVLLSIRIEPNGGLRLVRVKETSGYALLDKAAVSAVRKAVPLPEPPKGRASFDVPLKFSLE